MSVRVCVCLFGREFLYECERVCSSVFLCEFEFVLACVRVFVMAYVSVRV